MKKTLFSTLAIVLCILFCFAGCKGKTETNGGVVDQSEEGASSNIIQNKSDIEKVGEEYSEVKESSDILTFLSNNYYLEGTIYSADTDEPLPVKLANDGSNLQVTTTTSGITFGFLKIGDKTYMSLPDKAQFTELSESFLKVFGFDSDAFDFSQFQQMDISDQEAVDNSKKSQYSVKINGKSGVCTTFEFDSTDGKSYVYLYTIDDKLVEVDSYEGTEDNLTLQMVISSISSDIPANQLTTKGLTEVSAASFYSSLAGAAMAQAQQ